MTSVASPLITELDDAVANGSSERRVRMLRQLTDLFLSDSDRLNEQQITVFDDVLLRLLERAEERALAQLSSRFSDNGRAPKGVVRQLAKHGQISIAGPVLSRSERLSDNDLVSVAKACGEAHLMAISERKILNTVVTDALLQRGNVRVSYKLVDNMGARFSPTGYSVLVNRAEKDEMLAERVGLRLDTPANILKVLLRKVTDTVRARMIRAASPEIRKRIQAIVDTANNDVKTNAEVTKKASLAVDYDESTSAVLDLNRRGRLNEALIGHFARDGEFGKCIVALSLLGKVAINVIEPLFCGEKPDGLIVVCRAANLGWPTTLMILRSRPGQPPAALLDLEQSRQMFHAITLISAQRTVQAWSKKSAAKKPAAPKALAAV